MVLFKFISLYFLFPLYFFLLSFCLLNTGINSSKIIFLKRLFVDTWELSCFGGRVGKAGEWEMGTFSFTSSQPSCMLWYARGEPLKLLLRNKLQTWFNFSRRRKHAYKLTSCLPAQQEALSAVSFRMRQTWAWLLLSPRSNVALGCFLSISKASSHQ